MKQYCPMVKLWRRSERQPGNSGTELEEIRDNWTAEGNWTEQLSIQKVFYMDYPCQNEFSQINFGAPRRLGTDI